MKKCKHYLNNMSAYIDNELDTTCRTDLETHLKECAQCQNEFNKILLISNSLSKNEIEAPEGFMSSLKAKLSQEEVCVKKKKSIFTYVNFRTCSALLAILVLVISFKSPIYDNVTKHTDSKYRLSQNSEVPKKDNQNFNAKFVVIDKEENITGENASEKTKNDISNDAIIDVPSPLASQTDDALAKPSDDNTETKFDSANLTLSKQQEYYATIVESAIEEETSPETTKASGGSGGSSYAKTNASSITLQNTDKSIEIIEKYFGDKDAIVGELSYENYVNFKNEIADFTVLTNESVTDETSNVKVEIFLS